MMEWSMDCMVMKDCVHWLGLFERKEYETIQRVWEQSEPGNVSKADCS